MPRPATIVFVDALAEVYLRRFPDSLGFVSSLPNRTTIVPGLGFSINIKAELLAGLTPDDLGFFCKWSYSREPRFHLPSVIRLVGSLFDRTQLSSRVVHRIASRIVGVDLFTIPFAETHLFDTVSFPEAYDASFPRPTLLSRGAFERVVPGPGLGTDARVARQAVDLMPSAGNLYVSLVEPDAVGHRRGPDSPAMAAKLAETDDQVRVLWEAHERLGRGIFLLFSDHGMAPVTEKPWLDPKEVLGKPGRESYACFSDSTMLRFWIFRDSVTGRIEEMLKGVSWGRVLSDEERRRFGVASAVHGDVILLAHEGVVPRPSHVGGKHPRAIGMHGYHPDLESQHAFVCWTGGDDAPTVRSGLPSRIQARDLPALWASLAGSPR